MQEKPHLGIEYLGSYKCTLDALIQTIESIRPRRQWNLDNVVDTVIDFWLNNSETVNHWKRRLQDAGEENLLVSRLAELPALQAEFERIFHQE